MMPTEHEVQAVECPNGHHPLTDPQIIGCKHILCRSCIDHATTDNRIKCPTCSQVSRPTDVSCMTVIRGYAASQAVAGACYPKKPAHIGPKAMEEDLLDDPDLDDWDSQGQVLDPMDLEDDISTDGSEYTQTDSQRPIRAAQDALCPPKQIFEYAPLVKGDREEELEQDSSWDISAVLEMFYDATKEIEPIQGFYQSAKKDKIYVDVDDGSLKQVELFFKDHFTREWDTKRIEIVEQNNQCEFLIFPGDKIAAGRIANTEHGDVLQKIGQHPDNLDSYGTVTCLGVSDTNEQYAITAKHILSTENRPQSESGCYVSSFNSELKEISQMFMGILGGFDIDGKCKQVDIAALPIVSEIVNRFDPRLVHSLNDIYRDVDDKMLGAIVTKRGATSGYTTGQIIQVDYNLKKSKLITGGHFLIAPSESCTDFCVKGDSGSLVWSTTGVPIGIVSRGFKDYMFQGQKINVTLAVRLNDCLKALQSLLNVNIITCKAYGAPLPYAPSQPV